MRQTTLTALIAIAGVLSPASGRSDDKQAARQPQRLDAEVVSKVHDVNELEMKLGKLAVAKGQNPAVRQYGDMLYRDHKRADEQILGYARARKIPLLSAREAGADAQKEQSEDAVMTQKLEGVSGVEFDREFLAAMEKGHQKTIDMLTSVAPTLDEPKLRTMLTAMIPDLKKHLRLAQALGRRTEAQAGQKHG